MEDDKFDHLSRTLAARADRRQALRAVGTGGALAAVAGAFGFGSRNAAANAITDPVDCKLPFLSKVATGKNKGKRFDGDLKITIEANGAIDAGQLTASDGKTYDVVGQATGRTLNLRIKITNDTFRSLIGTGVQDITACKGRVDGTFGGWAEDDLGVWSLGVEPNVATPPAQATIASGNGGGSSNGSGNGGGGGNDANGSGGNGGGGSTDAPTPTPTPCPPQDCGGTFVWLPDQCVCGCPPPSEKCGETMCCPGGSVCDAAGGSCSCPSGTEMCGEACVQSCATGSTLNFTTCVCETKTSCGAGETLCNGACITIACNANQLFDATQCMCVNRCAAGQDYCNGTCISISTNSDCGSCGNVCQPGKSCYGTYCDCPPDYTYDAALGMCFPPCAVACINGATCVNGVCK